MRTYTSLLFKSLDLLGPWSYFIPRRSQVGGLFLSYPNVSSGITVYKTTLHVK